MESYKLPERLPFSKKRLPKTVILSYILDYAILIGLMVVFTIIDKVTPFHQPFAMENYTLHYPFATKERVPVSLATVLCVGVPAAIIAFYTLVIDGIFSHSKAVAAQHGLRRLSGKYRLKDRLWELNCGILGLLLSVGFAFTVTGALKNAIGKPRPDLIDRCKVKPDWENEPTVGDSRWPLRTISICSQSDNSILQDGFKSFPSGHSSTAFAGLFYLSLYLAAKLHVLDSKGEVWKSFIVLVPTLGAALIAGSRIMDARHHPFDVLSGSAMGIGIAWASYRQYFPPLHETWRKGRAYPIRAWGQGPQGPPAAVRVDDDMEPLHAPDVEQRAATTGFSSRTAAAGDSDEYGTNVFRQQISQSQRQREEGVRPFAIQPSDTMQSTLSTKVARYQNELPGPSPFADSSRVRGRENYEYSSSEDESGSYELRQPRGGTYNPVAGDVADTEYRSQTAVPAATYTAPRTQPTGGTTGDLGESRTETAPTVPTHATGTVP